MNPPFSMEGTTATHCAEPITSMGIPLSGADMISSTTSAAARTRSTALLSSALCAAAVEPTWAGEAFTVGCAAGVWAGVVLEVCEKDQVAQQITSSAKSFFMISYLGPDRLPDEQNGH